MRLPPVFRFALVFALSLLPPAQAQPGAPAPAADSYTLTLAPGPAAPDDAGRGSIEFIGAATVLLRYQGLTILTDPSFLRRGERISLGYGFGSERLVAPSMAFGALPPIDLVLLSHMHEDHFDREVQRQLRRDVPIVTTREAGERLARLGFTQRYALSRWDSFTLRKGEATLRITALPGRHGPPGATLLLPTVMGAMLDFAAGPGGPAYRLYISGDTVLFDDIGEIAQRFPNIDLALLHLGGARLFGMLKVTMDGKDGLRMLQLLAPARAIPLHYNDYDIYKSPLGDFQQAVRRAGLEQKVIYLRQGDSYGFSPAPPPEKSNQEIISNE